MQSSFPQWGSLRSQHIWSVIDTAGPEKTILVTMVSSLSGKYTLIFEGWEKKGEGGYQRKPDTLLQT